MTRYERTMLALALIRTVGVVFVVLCWIFTIYSAIGSMPIL